MLLANGALPFSLSGETGDHPGRSWAAWVLGIVVTLMLGGEFILAGVLYWRVRKGSGSAVAAILSITSFVIAGLIGLVGLIVGLAALVTGSA